MAKILIVDDEPQIRRILSVMLKEKGFEVEDVESSSRAITVSREFRPDVALLDVNMPDADGLTTLRTLLDQGKNIHCIMMTAHGTIRSAVEAIKMGAFHYLTKPFDNDELLLIINRALELSRLSNEVEELRGELSARYGFNEIIGISPRLQAVFHTMMKVARVDATVLIHGESGTGKELIARAIHRRSQRAQGPFVPVNCGAVPPSLFEAGFFGHERGAFTDAKERRQGYFELAHGGTLFLDEVGELPLESQVKLLRALQSREVTRLGGRHPIKFDARVIAATNIDLKAGVEQGRFREDLYWRLNVVKLVPPSLRERREDIPLLIDHLLERFSRELGLNVIQITPDARRLLSLHDWPGNVRELENTLCSAMIMCEGNQIVIGDLPARIRGEINEEAIRPGSAAGSNTGARPTLADTVKEATDKIEKMMIISKLSEMNGNRTAAAKALGISRKSLFNKMRQYGLSNHDIDNQSTELLE